MAFCRAFLKNYCGYHDLLCVSRPAAAAPAVGSLKVHTAQQQALVREALCLPADAEINGFDPHLNTPDARLGVWFSA
ncbi:MAG: hypothetical protein R3E95_19780 [Thiolinea sp.]